MLASRPPRAARPSRLRLLPLCCLALAAIGTKGPRLFSFTLGARSQGAPASCTARRGDKRVGRVALNEAIGNKGVHSLLPSSQAGSKAELLQLLLVGNGNAREALQLVSKLLLTTPRRAGAFASSVCDGVWHILSSSLLESQVKAPNLSFFSERQFMHNGSIQNGGLFKAIAQREGADVKFSMPRVSIADGVMGVSVQVQVAPGNEKAMSFAAELQHLGGRTFKRRLKSLDLPQPVGSLKPVLETDDLIDVVYADDDLLILGDESGHTEILLRESAAAWAFHRKSDELRGADEFVELPILALSR